MVTSPPGTSALSISSMNAGLMILFLACRFLGQGSGKLINIFSMLAEGKWRDVTRYPSLQMTTRFFKLWFFILAQIFLTLSNFFSTATQLIRGDRSAFSAIQAPLPLQYSTYTGCSLPNRSAQL